MSTVASTTEAGGGVPVTPRELFGRAFEDILVGHEFSTPGRTVTEADVVSFSAWTGDRNPMHTDAHWSEEHGIFGQRVAHGMLILSYAIGLIPLDPARVIALRRIRDVVFKRPVMLGDTLHAHGSVVSLHRRPRFGAVVTLLDVVNHRDEVVVRGTFELLWRLETTEPGER